MIHFLDKNTYTHIQNKETYSHSVDNALTNCLSIMLD